MAFPFEPWVALHHVGEVGRWQVPPARDVLLEGPGDDDDDDEGDIEPPDDDEDFDDDVDEDEDEEDTLWACLPGWRAAMHNGVL